MIVDILFQVHICAAGNDECRITSLGHQALRGRRAHTLSAFLLSALALLLFTSSIMSENIGLVEFSRCGRVAWVMVTGALPPAAVCWAKEAASRVTFFMALVRHKELCYVTDAMRLFGRAPNSENDYQQINAIRLHPEPAQDAQVLDPTTTASYSVTWVTTMAWSHQFQGLTSS